jgi:translation initiation factor 1
VRNSRLVYSSEGGRFRDADPRRPISSVAASKRGRFPEDGVIRIVRDRGGRGGKVVTVIHGLRERGAALDARASELRRLCGAGGTVKDGVVEIQGDHRERVAERLRALGFTVKLAGG